MQRICTLDCNFLDPMGNILNINPIKWFRRNLLRRLVGPSFVLSLVAVVLVSAIAYYQVRDALIDNTYARLESSLDLHDAELKRWIFDQKREVIFLARTPFFREHVADMLSYKSSHLYYNDAYKALSEFLFSYIKTFPGIREIMFLSGRDGRILISTHKENEGSSRAEYPFFAKGKEEIFIQGVYSWKETGEPAISVVKPLRDADGTYNGVLAVHLDLERMGQVVFGNSGLGKGGETYIVNPQHRLIRATQPGQAEFSQEAISVGIQQAVAGRQGVGLYENYAGVPVVGAYRWLPELGVALLAEINQEEAFAAARNFGILISAIGLLLSGLLFLGNLLAARRIARPVLDLALAASKVAEGNLSVRVDVHNDDEIGVLAESFNSMVDRLNALYDDLQANVTYFSTVFQLSPNAIAVLNFETGVFTAANESFGKLFDFHPQEAIGHSVVELGLWQSRVSHLRLMALLKKESVVEGTNVEFHRQDGSSFEGILSARLIELNGVQHVIVVFWDMSDLLRAEEDLRSSRERLQLLIDRMPIGCIVWNTKFEVELWNPAAEQIFGYTSAEARGRQANNLIVPEEVHPQVEGIYERILAGDAMAHSENANTTKDGRTIICDWYNTPLSDKQNNTIGALSMVRDITERKKTEEELEHHRLHLEELVSDRTRQLEEAQAELVEKERLAVLGQLTATVSHELRNPLGTVSNAIFAIRDAVQKEKTERLESCLALAERNVHRCDAIISELLDFTRAHELRREALELGPWLHEVINEQKGPGQVELVLRLPAGFVVDADPERLRRAVINILENAVQALGEISSKDKKICFSLGREGSQVGITVSDNGPGISEEVRKRMFEPLFSTKGFGIGLGMSVVKNIVEDHGGNVTVSNAPEGGTNVTLWLPSQGEDK